MKASDHAGLGRRGSARGGWQAGERETTQNGSQEVEWLRREVADLQAKLADAQAKEAGRRQPRSGWRAPVAAVLIVIGCVLAPLSVLAVWTANEVSNTSTYVANVAPLISQPAIRDALTNKVSTAVSAELDVQGLTKQIAAELNKSGLPKLSSLLSGFSGSIASGVDGLIHSAVAKVVASPQVRRLWINGNRAVHEQLVLALEGKKSALTISGGKVVLSLGPIIDRVKNDLSKRGLTIVSKLPPINPTYPLFSAKYLVQAQSLYRTLNTLKWVLPVLALIFIAAGVYVARRHRRALVGAGLGLAASMLVLGILLAVGRSIYLSKLPASFSADAAAVAFDTIVRFIKQGLRVVLVVGLVVAVAAFFTGPSVTAARTRQAFKSGFAAIRRAGERFSLTTGPVGTWVYQYRQPLRIGAVAVAALIFVFWGNPTGVTVIVVAVILLALLGLIELIGRPPRAGATASE